MKITKIMVLLFLAIFLVQANDNKNILLLDFANKLSLQNNINIYIDEDLKDKKISLFVPDSISNYDMLSIFKSTISKLNLNLVGTGTTYYLTKKIKLSDDKYLYKLKYNSFADCNKILKSFGYKYLYLNDVNSFLISTTFKNYTLLKKYLNIVDVKQNQVILKIMIFEFNNNDLTDIGISNLVKNQMDVSDIAINAILAPLNSSTLTLSSNKFYGALRFLNEHSLLKVKQFPYVLARHNDNFKFEAVENVPYLTSTIITDATNVSEQTRIEYRDVGLKINGKTLIYENYITLEIDLIIEDFMNSSETNTPKTYKRHLNSKSDVDYNNVLLLSGIKRTKHEVINYSIPFISNIPYLGEIFKYKSRSESELNITIAIEVIKDTKFNHDYIIDYIDDNNQSREIL